MRLIFKFTDSQSSAIFCGTLSCFPRKFPILLHCTPGLFRLFFILPSVAGKGEKSELSSRSGRKRYPLLPRFASTIEKL